MNDIEQRFCTEPSRYWRPNCLIRIRRLLIPNLRGDASSPPSSCIRQQLRMTGFLHRQEPEYSRFDRLAHGKETVILEEGSLLVPKAGGNVSAFFLREDDAIEGFV